MKRKFAVAALLAVLALALIGAQVLAPVALSSPTADQASLTAPQDGIVLVSDEPVCPPGAPPPC